MASSIPAAGKFRSQHNEFQMCPLDTYSHRNLNSNQCRSICTPPACPWYNCYAVLDPENKSICMTAGFDVKSPGQEAKAQLLYPTLANYYHSNISSSTFPGHMCTRDVLSLVWTMLMCRTVLFAENTLCQLSVLGVRQFSTLLCKRPLFSSCFACDWVTLGIPGGGLSSEPIYL